MDKQIKKPNFFIVGAPKCGTTALSEYLRTHPKIFFSSPKEPHYFSEDFRADPRWGAINSLDHYLWLFQNVNDNHMAVGEGSPFYLYSTVAIEKIFKFNRNAKIIVMLRNPIDMAYSLHAEFVFSCVESEKDFKKAWYLQERREKGENIPPNCKLPKLLLYHNICRFGEQVQRLFNIFHKDQIDVILFDDFISSTENVYEGILSFLGLPPNRDATFPIINESKQHKSQWLSEIINNPPPLAKNTVKFFKKRLGVTSLGLGGVTGLLNRINSKKHKKPTLSSEFRSEMLEQFKGDILLLQKLINRDLSSWLSIEPSNK